MNIPVQTIAKIIPEASNNGDGRLMGYCVPSGSVVGSDFLTSLEVVVVVIDSFGGASSSSEGVEYSILR
jgi:hypothetical protein